jgi:6-phosphogluconolactonase (cycloisomerase 2 family)
MKLRLSRHPRLPALGAILALTLPLLFAGEAEPATAVYTMSNAPAGNEVLVFAVRPSGKLEPAGAVATGGLGTGGSLGNQGGLVLDPGERWLFAVNAGDGTISSFEVTQGGLALVDTESSGGFRPVSLTVFGTVLYVLNEGDPGNSTDSITGFRINGDGTLTPLGVTRPLSAGITDPAQIGFNTQGTVLLVTEKATSMITTYTVDPDGTASAPISRPSAVPTPFGFQFGNRDVVFITEANPGGPGAVVSYRVDPSTGVVSDAIDVLGAEAATCWVALSNDRTIGYATNTGSASISVFRIDFDGGLEPFFADGRSVGTGNGPLDLALTRDGRNLYTLNAADSTIRAFTVTRGDLPVRLGDNETVPPGANGLAAR